MSHNFIMSANEGLVKIETSGNRKLEEYQRDKFKRLGISNIDSFNKWVKQDLGITVNDRVRIKYSEGSGIGLVYDVSDGFEIRSDVELLRIPHGSVLNIYRFLEVVNELVKFERSVSELSPDKISPEEIEFYAKYKQSEIIKRCIKEIVGVLEAKESLILVGYLIGFIVCLKLREFYKIKDTCGSGIGNSELTNPLCKFNQYLYILQNTIVESINSEDLISLEYYYDLFPGETNFTSQYLFLQEINDEIEFIKFINSEFGEKDGHKIKLIDSDLFLQILSAVSSRTLEIPRQVDNDSEGEGDDFTIDVTLVPILDFVNHDNIKLNSFFDIDRETNDIILKLDLELYDKNCREIGESSNSKEIEIFISYSPIEEIFKFFFNYGFIPKIITGDESGDERIVQVIDIPFIGYFKFPNCDKIEEFVYKYKINPNIQFTITNKNKIKVNLLDNYSFVCFLPGFKIDEYIKEEEGDEEDEDEGDEGSADLAIVENIVNQYSEEEITIGLIKLFEIFYKYLKYQIKILNKLKQRICELDTEGGLNLIELIEFKIDLYTRFINKIDQLKKDNNTDGDGVIDIYSLLEQPEDEEEYGQLIEIGTYRGPYRWYRSKLIVFDDEDMTEGEEDEEVTQRVGKLGLN